MKNRLAGRIDPARFPEASSIEQKIRFLIDYAVLAPSSHDTEPWKFGVRGNAVEVRADLERWLQVADPQRRELYVSLGCALENLLIAAERFGFGHEIVFHADADRHQHAATVTLLAEGAPSTCRPAELFEAIVARATSRRPYEPRGVPEDALAQLRECATDPGIGLWLTEDAAARARLCELVVCADRALFRDRDWRRELGGWIGRGALGDSPLRARMARLALTHLDLGRRQARQDARALRHTPILGVLLPARRPRVADPRGPGVRAPRAAGNQPRPRRPAAEPAAGGGRDRPRAAVSAARSRGFAAAPFRLGYARAPARRTPRRPVAAVVAS